MGGGENQLWLTPAEVEQLTGRKRHKAQCRALADMGVPFEPNAIGRPLVLRSRYEPGASKPRAKAQPNWSAIRGTKAA